MKIWNWYSPGVKFSEEDKMHEWQNICSGNIWFQNTQLSLNCCYISGYSFLWFYSWHWLGVVVLWGAWGREESWVGDYHPPLTTTTHQTRPNTEHLIQNSVGYNEPITKYQGQILSMICHNRSPSTNIQLHNFTSVALPCYYSIYATENFRWVELSSDSEKWNCLQILEEEVGKDDF